jgi:hypothetical protein
MTQEVLRQMYQLLLTEPHAPTVCAQLERIAREALADHAMRETQRLGQEIEQESVAWVSEDVCKGQYIDGRPRKIWWECNKGVGTAFYTRPPPRTEQKPVAWMDADGNVSDNNDHKCFPIPLYTKEQP